MVKALREKSSSGSSMNLGVQSKQRGMAEIYQHSMNEWNNFVANPCVGSDRDLDGLLANAGYTVKASDLAHVAQRLQQLESVLGAAQEAGISHLSSEAVHYNPSDLAGWIECMIDELAPSLPDLSTRNDGGESGFGQVDSSTLEEASSTFLDGSSQQASRFSEVTFLEDLEGLYHRLGSEGQNLCNNTGDLYSGLDAVDAGDVPQGMDICGGGNMSLQHTVYPDTERTHEIRHRNIKDSVRPQPFSDEMCQFEENLRQSIDQGTRFSAVPGQIHRFSNGVYAQQPVMYADVDDDAQESGIRLVHLLLACAEALQGNDLAAADEIVKEIRRLASPRAGAMGKVAGYFVEALARRIYGIDSQDSANIQTDSLSELLYFHFYETCPYLKFAHFTANQAILEAFEGQKQVHVIDFNLMQGLQWPALIQALALRPGGPPRLRLTGIGPPQPDGKDVLQEIGMKLAQLAESVNVEFDFRGVVATKLDDVKPWMLRVKQGEAVAVNSILQLHRLLNCEASRPPIDEVLQSMRSLNPRIITVVEQEANHNSPIFLDRFMQALHHYSTMFDSLEACNLPPQSSEQVLAEMYLGREICNIVACEGNDRVERHETLSQWRLRMSGAGFRPLHLGSNAFKQARMLLTLFSGEGYTVEENNGSLTLGWHSRPLIAASAWQCSSDNSSFHSGSLWQRQLSNPSAYSCAGDKTTAQSPPS